MSEDEDAASQQPNYAMAPQNNPNARRQGPAISQDYLSRVLASLNQQLPAQPAAPQPAPQQTQAQPQAQQPAFDRNYFNGLMQQLFSQPPAQATASQPSSVSTPAPAQTQPQPQTERITPDAELAAKLEQMHELGFLDDELNLRALQLTEGNVDAAVSFIIEGGDI
jgi:ubiquilin